MLDDVLLKNVLVLDVETVSGHKSYEDLSPTMQKLWEIKSQQIQRRVEEDDRLDAEASFTERAGIYAEFGKIVCISVGLFKKVDGEWNFYLKSYYGDDEKQLLEDFSVMMNKFFPNDQFTNKYTASENMRYICGHNIKEFDVPYICRRMVINGLELPPSVRINGKKPWELNHLLDTLHQWKFGDYKNYTSLKLLCGVFDIPTPKDDIDGSEVGRTYWEEEDLDRIEVYCKKDVLATARLLMAYKLMPLIEEDAVIDKDKDQDEED